RPTRPSPSRPTPSSAPSTRRASPASGRTGRTATPSSRRRWRASGAAASRSTCSTPGAAPRRRCSPRSSRPASSSTPSMRCLPPSPPRPAPLRPDPISSFLSAMRAFFRLAPLGLVAAAALVIAGATPEFGADRADRAPDFTLTDTRGNVHTLSDYAGQWVVLEWLNYECPFVGKYYDSGSMQHLQEHYTGLGVVWLSIVSSAPGEQGHYPPDEMNARTEAHGGKQTAILMDPTGEVGRAYGARTTPHMFVITPQGEIVYN